MEFHHTETNRQLHNLLRLGTVAETDPNNGKIRVQTGEIKTGWLPYPAYIGANFRAWSPVRIGQQVLLASPSGDLRNAIVCAILYDDANQPPSTDESEDVIQFDDGSVIKKHKGGYDISITTGTLNLTAPNITINGNVAISGGSLTHNGTNVGSTHTHGGIKPGGDSTSPPN